MSEYRDKLIQDLYDLNVHADITIEELADDIIDDIKHINGRNYVEMFGDCPMCTDCPDGCSLDKQIFAFKGEKMKIQKYDDGIAFLKDDVEIAFYSYIVDRVTFYPQSNEEWSDYGSSSVKVEDLFFIANIVKVEKKKLVKIKVEG